MIPIWQQYFDCAHSLLYILNVTEPETLATAVTELQQALTHPEMQVSAEQEVVSTADRLSCIAHATAADQHHQTCSDALH